MKPGDQSGQSGQGSQNGQRNQSSLALRTFMHSERPERPERPERKLCRSFISLINPWCRGFDESEYPIRRYGHRAAWERDQIQSRHSRAQRGQSDRKNTDAHSRIEESGWEEHRWRQWSNYRPRKEPTFKKKKKACIFYYCNPLKLDSQCTRVLLDLLHQMECMPTEWNVEIHRSEYNAEWTPAWQLQQVLRYEAEYTGKWDQVDKCPIQCKWSLSITAHFDIRRWRWKHLARKTNFPRSANYPDWCRDCTFSWCPKIFLK